MKRNVVKAEMTAFLSLIFLLVMSFVGGMMEVVSIQLTKSHRRAQMSLAVESVFAEYNRKLLERYDIFALDGEYSGEHYSDANILNRLIFYGAHQGENKIIKSEVLTDESGRPFYEQAIAYMKNKMGMDMQMETEGSRWDQQEMQGQDFLEKEEELQDNIDQIFEEENISLPEEGNPLESVESVKKSNLLQMIMKEPEKVSQKCVQRQGLASVRELMAGKGGFEQADHERLDVEQMLFYEYLLEHYSNALEIDEENALSYELEYLIGGSESDQENLRMVLKKILMLRTGINYAYLLTDEAKQAEAELMSLAVCSLLTVPGITEIVKQALLMSWAYGEGVVDARRLMQGEKIPFVKTSESWRLSITDLVRLSDKNVGMGERSEQGMGYREYLRGLLYLQTKETLSMRAIDLIEQNIGICADHCFRRLEVDSTCRLRRGILYEFSTYYGYQ